MARPARSTGVTIDHSTLPPLFPCPHVTMPYKIERCSCYYDNNVNATQVGTIQDMLYDASAQNREHTAVFEPIELPINPHAHTAYVLGDLGDLGCWVVGCP